MKTIEEEFPPASKLYDLRSSDAISSHYTRLRARAVEMERAQSAIEAYRGLWSRIPEKERQRMESVMLQWAPDSLANAFRAEMAARESSPEWKPSLGDFARNFR